MTITPKRNARTMFLRRSRELRKSPRQVAAENSDLANGDVFKTLTTVLILTFNEAIHIRRAIESARLVAHNIVVVDSFSNDDTASICEQMGVNFVQNRFLSQAKQICWALENVNINTEWIFRLDADEVIEEELVNSLRRELPRLDNDIAGIIVKRKHYFMGRWIRFGGRFPLHLLRLWRTGLGLVEDRWMDEHMLITKGRTLTLPGCIADRNLGNIGTFIDKHNKYASREAIEILDSKYHFLKRDYVSGSTEGARQAKTKRRIKEQLYNRAPFVVSSTAYFLYRYILLLGFLDGLAGFIYHFYQAWWYRMLVGVKVKEILLLAEQNDGDVQQAAADYTKIQLQ